MCYIWTHNTFASYMSDHGGTKQTNWLTTEKQFCNTSTAFKNTWHSKWRHLWEPHRNNYAAINLFNISSCVVLDFNCLKLKQYKQDFFAWNIQLWADRGSWRLNIYHLNAAKLQMLQNYRYGTQLHLYTLFLFLLVHICQPTSASGDWDHKQFSSTLAHLS